MGAKKSPLSRDLGAPEGRIPAPPDTHLQSDLLKIRVPVERGGPGWGGWQCENHRNGRQTMLFS